MRFRRTLAVVTVACVGPLLVRAAALAAPASLDPTFGGDGKVTTNFTGSFDGAAAVAIQGDGKVVAVGSAGSFDGRFAIARYDTDGSLDPTFGGDGTVRTNFTRDFDAATAVAIQGDGKIVVAGETRRFTRVGIAGRFALARYETDGSLDTTFGGGDGKVTTDLTPGWDRGSGVAIQADGKIVVAGAADAACSCSRFALARYETDGSLDATFGGDGTVTTRFPRGPGSSAQDVTIQGDGKIVAVGGQLPEGSRFFLVRYETDGSRDTTFAGDGRVRTRVGRGEGTATSVVLQSDAKIVVAGYGGVPHEFGDPFRPRIAVARYLVDGSLDPLFSGNGVATTGSRGQLLGEDVAIQTDGKIVVAGRTFRVDGRFTLARFRRQGRLDDSFGRSGVVKTNFTPGEDAAWGVALQADGRIVAAGQADGRGGRFALARYLGG
jgi:uncharacterized delta-60 repeat protein